jgi:hypothetical protein
LEYYRFTQAQTRHLLSEKTQECQDRKELFYSEKLERNKDQLVKWDLFRQRREVIRDRFIDIKRDQINIK